VGRAATNALFGLAERIDAFVAWLPSLPGRVREAMRKLVEAPARALREGARRLAAWVLGVLAAAATALREFFRGDELRVGGSSEEAPAGGAAGGSGATSRRSLAAAWRVLVELVSPSRLRQRTPAEIGRLAIERGLPDEPVRTLTAAYEHAVYGPTGASEEDVERAREAASELERAASLETSAGVESSGDASRAGNASAASDPSRAGSASGASDPSRAGSASGAGDPSSPGDEDDGGAGT